jgi:ATP-dependent Clp protease ATP-binding subunit ClpA
MKAVEARVAKKGVRITLTEEALGYLIDQGFNPDFGARPLKRAIERLVEDPLSEGLLRGEFKEAKHIHISLKDKHLFFEPMETGGDKKEVGAGSGGEGSKK